MHTQQPCRYKQTHKKPLFLLVVNKLRELNKRKKEQNKMNELYANTQQIIKADRYTQSLNK